MRVRLAAAAGLMASLLVVVAGASCHARLLWLIQLRDREALVGTTTETLARDYRNLRMVLPEWCRPLGAGFPAGDTANEINAELCSDFGRLMGPLWIVAPRPNLSWMLPLSLWLLLVHLAGVVVAMAFVRWRAGRGALRRGGPSALRRRAEAPAMFVAAAAYVLTAPLAGGAAWLATFDIWWPGILDPREAFPSVLGALVSGVVCVAAALGAGWVGAWFAILCRIPRDAGLHARRCANCGYDPGRNAVDLCPECGMPPRRRRWSRRVLAILVCGPCRLAIYITLIGGITSCMYIWAFGPPHLPELNPWMRPKYTLAMLALNNFDPEFTWRNGETPTLIRWSDGTLLYAERVEEGGDGEPFRVWYATAWLPRGRDAQDPGSWLFESHYKAFLNVRYAGMIKVQFEGDRLFRLAREYRGPYLGNMTLSYISEEPNSIEKVFADNPLAKVGRLLLKSLDDAQHTTGPQPAAHSPQSPAPP